MNSLAPTSENAHFVFVDVIYFNIRSLFSYFRVAVAAEPAPRSPWMIFTAPIMSPELIGRVWKQLCWIELRLRRAIERAVAGVAPRPSRPRPSTRQDSSRDAIPVTRKPALLPLPRSEGWLTRYMLHVHGMYGAPFARVLADPEFAPYLVHPSVLRLLRPLCRMLGISDALPPRSTPPRRKPARPLPASAASPLPPAGSGAAPAAPPATPLPATTQPAATKAKPSGSSPDAPTSILASS